MIIESEPGTAETVGELVHEIPWEPFMKTTLNKEGVPASCGLIIFGNEIDGYMPVTRGLEYTSDEEREDKMQYARRILEQVGVLYRLK